MQKQHWSISSKDNFADDDDDIIQAGKISLNQFNENIQEEEEEEEQPALKPANTFKMPKQAMTERKLQESDARGQLFK